MAAVKQRDATFREERRFAALEGALLSTGTLAYGPGHLDKVTDWPQPERLEVQGERIVLMQGNDAPRVIDMARAPELRTLVDAIRGPLQGDAASLRRAFQPKLSGTMASWTLDLVPRDPAAAKLLHDVRLEGHDDQIARITLSQANGDTQAMTITPR